MSNSNARHDQLMTLSLLLRPWMVLRTLAAGALMGLANLVPGVSGGTMILVMGLYETFVHCVADLTRLRITKVNVIFVGSICCAAGLAVLSCAGVMHHLVTVHQSKMYALFIGLTLGGAPLLYRMIAPLNGKLIAAIILGFLLMVGMAQTKQSRPNKDAIKAQVKDGSFKLEPNYARDTVAGVLGVSAMVLPGISGAYMLLILDRYEMILAAVSSAVNNIVRGQGDDYSSLRIIVPVAIGTIVGIVAVSNLLKLLLRRCERPTIAVLLGIVLGSVVGIWPFDAESTPSDYALGALLVVVGLLVTYALSMVSRKPKSATLPT